MRTIVIQVDGMTSVCDYFGVEKRLRRHPGISRVEANSVAGKATVEYDETRVAVKDIKRLIGECGYGCQGECLPNHLCKPSDPPGD